MVSQKNALRASAAMPKIEETNVETATKHVNGLVDLAIKSSKDHSKILIGATIAATLFAAEHGQCGPLTRLHKEVSTQDAEGIRVFIVNMNTKFGVEVTMKDGTERVVSFLKYKKEVGFSLNRSDSENVEKGIKASKASVIKAGETELIKLPFGKIDREAAMSEAFDSIATVKRAIMTLARNGDGSLARAVNRVLGTNGYTDGEIDSTAKKNDPAQKLKEAREKVEKLEKQISTLPANANTQPAASAAVN